ncbi:amino acid transporter [Dactylosporangium sp. AC04546]|uniref:amino acid transporter n=1 Tax=Dactylosporangium sp. AC04546 TaxID=2862460 RepID=UPI001EE06DED|nr:amino acid transporter [Dactylosporangium sp. AC04546]WVK78846.1 amino acid transporter [Dactylosporangium sp. AC04546]
MLRDLHAGQSGGPHAPAGQAEQRPWWQVMCLTGLDYFSTLGYQPGIAALAAGVVSPIATLILVLLTLLGALPVYRRVARESPHGQGSIAMLERILPRWTGKLFVLALLGFAATDFIITITLSAADATAHVLENPYVRGTLDGQQVTVTLILVALLGAVFLKGFKEAIGIAVGIVAVYLALNVVVIGIALQHVAVNPHLVGDWTDLLRVERPSLLGVALVALIVFPKLALGLSGFETGVAVMPLIQGGKGDDPHRPQGRIRGAHRLLTTAAVIMSVMLVTSSFATTLLIPQHEFEEGGAAYGRALAFLAHEYLGNGFGTLYDVSTVLILWFAGASAMAGLLNLVPQYLPRYGMAPNWTRAVRPLTVVFTLAAFLITVIFEADVNAQGGAYATGVLVLITSAAVAVTMSARRRRQRKTTIAFAVVTLVFAYTTVDNVIERPDGVKIASLFILGIIVTSLLSRILRVTELRVTRIRLDPVARRLVDEAAASGELAVIANEPNARDEAEYREKETEQRRHNHIPAGTRPLFLEVTVRDPSDFETELAVTGEERHGYAVLKVESPSIANAIAALLLHLRDATGKLPHVYFNWTEGNPVAYLLRYLFLGDGEIAPVTREVLREAERDPERRPFVHVG